MSAKVVPQILFSHISFIYNFCKQDIRCYENLSCSKQYMGY
ncbi:hypothetical protein HMPREF1991_03225 [Hoylesella loescheii DSM 19665 = JCM 12249 = ATCC 15930]|uniref:Uncharacterized protein n=1 Tax=Hoylesella loescheii DSM 19665 = JCM 12249 = ATCC 15930 TaxID=1122985 RepID=A0A069QDK7_HOYLO|nr:hypothetical protein HMPREF1991_03225 [Hoylesella loescheii DSM 19665 = JCM 12249 = ATCC 15930]